MIVSINLSPEVRKQSAAFSGGLQFRFECFKVASSKVINPGSF